VIGTTDTPEVAPLAREAWRVHLGRDVPPAVLRRQLGEGSLPAVFRDTAAAHPDRPALEIDGAAATHGEIDSRAAHVTGWLRDRGVRRGDAVVVCGANSLPFVVAYVGALRAGAMVVLANPVLTEVELQHLVSDSAAVLAFADGVAHSRLASIARAGGSLRLVADVAALGEHGSALEREVLGSEPAEPVPAAADDIALLAYTSGTTGTPKAVPLTHRNLLSSIRAAMLAWRWSEDDVLVHALPLSHQHGLGGVHATLMRGSRALIDRKFDAARLCEQVRAADATVVFGVPAMYERLVARNGADGAALRSLRLLVSGSAPLSPLLARRIAAVAGQFPLERYGTTESGLNVSNPYDGPRRPGTVGMPLPGVELAVVEDDGSPARAGAAGEILLRGPQLFSGYRDDAQATSAAFHPGGWFRTGDIGRIRPSDGYLEITGRAKDLIISGGMNVYPREVEIALEQSPDVAHAAVVGVASDRWGEEVVAAVVPHPARAIDPEMLLEFARSRLAPYKCPKRFVVLDELPVKSMGKVSYSEVARLVAESP
jgi:malonyl-CoA/methylmalonyl-CoA synthetase